MTGVERGRPVLLPVVSRRDHQGTYPATTLMMGLMPNLAAALTRVRLYTGPSIAVRPDWIRHGLLAGGVAAVLSGAPSTLYALMKGEDPLEPTVAAGSILLPSETRHGPLVAASVPVHLALSLGWGVVLARILPRRNTILWGATAGLLIAALDLGVIGRLFPRIRALPLGPQLADHVAFGVVAGATLTVIGRP